MSYVIVLTLQTPLYLGSGSVSEKGVNNLLLATDI